MKLETIDLRRLFILTAGLAALAIGGPARASELKVLEPADCAIVKGTVNFRIQTEQAQGERPLSAPELVIQDETGNELTQLRALRDRVTGICTTSLDTRRYPDGQYLVRLKYRSLKAGKVEDTLDEMTLSFRNTRVHPAKFTVTMVDRPYKLDEPCEVTVKVTGNYGKVMGGARVSFKIDKGDVGRGTEISDSDGEVILNITGTDVANAVLTITVEDLAPVTRTIKFVE